MPAAMREPMLGRGYAPPANSTDPGTFGLGAGFNTQVTVDGTPARVAGMLLLSGAILAALKLAGFRFNMGV